MAAGTKIVMEFYNAAGTTTTHSYSYGNASATAASIKAYMNAAITNGSMFKVPPVSIKGAKAVVTTETTFDLSD